jgi:hypothetical protein
VIEECRVRTPAKREGVRRPDSNPLPYLVPVGVEAGEGLEIALELLEGLILL